MKTPKRNILRTCPECGWSQSREYPICPMCDTPNERIENNMAIRARWKRKNREAQLKRTIARQQREFAKREIEYHRKMAFWRSRALAAELACETICAVNDIMNTTSYFGQDIEGS